MSIVKRVIAIPILIVAAVVVAGQLNIWPAREPNDGALGQQNSEVSRQLESSTSQVIASNLEIPWELVFLPDGRMLVTERPGRLLLIGDEKKNYEVKEVAHIGEGGLLGAALDPDFTKNNFLYLYFTYRE